MNKVSIADCFRNQNSGLGFDFLASAWASIPKYFGLGLILILFFS